MEALECLRLVFNIRTRVIPETTKHTGSCIKLLGDRQLSIKAMINYRNVC